MPNHPADYRDFPGDSEERDAAALAVAGTTDPVSVHISDHGDFDGNHSPAQHSYASGEASVRDEDGMGYSTPDEIERQYEILLQNTIEIRERD